MVQLTPTVILEDSLHPDLTFVRSDHRMQLDIFLPELALALEYQGQQHYNDVFFFGPKRSYAHRDTEKKMACERTGITLIDVPYWWDQNRSSLAATIATARPDVGVLSPKGNLSIPVSPPTKPVTLSAGSC